MGDARARRPVAYRIQRLMRRRRQAAGAPGSSLFWLIQVSADSTSASSLAVNPSILTPVASAFFLASSALATECTHTRPRRTLAVNFCCFSSVIIVSLKLSYRLASRYTTRPSVRKHMRQLWSRNGAIQPRTVCVESLRDHPYILIRFIPAALFDGLAYARQRFHAVPG